MSRAVRLGGVLLVRSGPIVEINENVSARDALNVLPPPYKPGQECNPEKLSVETSRN